MNEGLIYIREAGRKSILIYDSEQEALNLALFGYKFGKDRAWEND
jgi:hypothetical protein